MRRALLVISTLFLTAAEPTATSSVAVDPAMDDPAASASAFETIAKVLSHPRCRNCHPNGDRPLHGDPPAPHTMNVQRRLAEVGMACGTCHQTHNTPGAHRPPGAPHWGLAPPEQIFEGRSPAQLCEGLRNEETNGGRSLAKLFHHLTADPLVLWGWSPGEGREPVPVPQPEFATAVRTWIETGAHCPKPSKESKE